MSPSLRPVSCLLFLLPFLLSFCLFPSSVSALPEVPDVPPTPGCSARPGASSVCIRIGVYDCPNNAPIAGFHEMITWYKSRVANELGGKFRVNGQADVPVFFKTVDMGSFAATKDQMKQLAEEHFIGPDPTNPLVDFVIFPPGSSWDKAMFALEQAKIPAIAGNSPNSELYQCASAAPLQEGCTQANARRFEYVHGAGNAGEQFFQDWVGLMKLKKAKTLAVVQTVVALYDSIRRGVETSAVDFSMDVVYTQEISVSKVNGVDVINEDDEKTMISNLRRTDPDGLVVSAQSCTPFIQAFMKVDYVPRSMATVLCTDNTAVWNTLGKEGLAYVVGSAQWSVDLSGNDYLETKNTQPWSMFPHMEDGKLVGDTSPKQFAELWRNLTNNPTGTPGYAEAAVLVGFTMLEGATYLSGNPDSEEINQQLKLYYQSSYYGLLSTNRYGTNQQKSLVINQRDSEGTLHVISPTSAATLDFIYPMPRFSERVYEQEMIGTEIEYIVIALMVICMVFTLSLCYYLFANRHQQVFQAAGLPFYIMMGIGCCVSYGSVLVWGVENNKESCAARIWMWTLGFHMFVDPLLASSWRISRIFSQKLQTVKLTNRMVGLVCLVIFAPQLLINILWHSIAPFEPKIVTADPLRAGPTSFTTCSGGDNGVIFTGVTLGYSGFLLLCACYLAYKVRKAYRMFNDAKPIATSMYIFTVTSAIILVIQIALNNPTVYDQKVLFGLRSVGVMLAYTSSISLLYFRRIMGQNEVNKYGKGGAMDNSSTTASTHSFRPPMAKASGNGGTTILFNKADHSHTGGAANSGMGKNVHVHIQPPQFGGGGDSGTPKAGPTRSGGLAPSPTRSSHGSSSRGSAATSSAIPFQVLQLPPPISMPSQHELSEMDQPHVVGLLNQVHAQNQVIRSQIRSFNLANGPAARAGLMTESNTPNWPSIGGGVGSTLPGTPDRSPRFQTTTTMEEASRRESYAAAKQGSGSGLTTSAAPTDATTVSIRTYQPDGSSSEAALGVTRLNSPTDDGEVQLLTGGADSAASPGVGGATTIEMSPVSEIQPESLTH